MRNYEKVCGAVMAATIPTELIAAMGMESDAGAWAVWLLLICAALQLTAMAVVKIMWEREERREAIRVPRQLIHRLRERNNPSTAVRRSPSLYTREARAVEDARLYGHNVSRCEEVRK